MDNEREVLLKVSHLCQFFGSNKAVNDVSFEVYKGEVFGLVGETGCGKTTTGRDIIKLYDATSGDVYFKGVRTVAGTLSYYEAIKKAKSDNKNGVISDEECAKIIRENRVAAKKAKYDQKNCDKEYQKIRVAEVKNEYKKRLKECEGAEKKKINSEFANELRKARKTRLTTQIQMIFQDPVGSLDPRMTVREIISEGLIIQGEKNKNVINEKVYNMLELVGLVREHAERYPHEFSGGQKQRIGIARAVIMNPEMIIADEPVSALDVSIQAQVINLLNDIRDKMDLTIIFIAHDLSVVKYFSDRIGVMYFGRLVELAPSDELFLNPLHPYTRSLLSAIPLPDPEYEKTRRRIEYRPLVDHDYTVEKPTFREIKPGHFVDCNEAEFSKYLEILK